MAISNFAQKVTQAPNGATNLVLSQVTAGVHGTGNGSVTYPTSFPAGLYQLSFKAHNLDVANTYAFKDAYGTVIDTGTALTTDHMVELTEPASSLTVSYTENSWVVSTIINSKDILAGTYGNGLYIIAGATGSLATSTDAITWTERTSTFQTDNIYALTYGNGIYVAAGQSGQIRTSTDAITWTTRTSGFSSTDILALAYGNGVFVAGGGNGSLRVSTDGVTWDVRTSNFGTSAINALAYGAGLFVAGGASGQIRTSFNTFDWTTRTSNFGASTIYALTYGNGIYVAAGQSGQIRTSTDAITWTTRTSNFPSTQILRGATYGGGYFAVGGGNSSTGDQIRTSTDGITWTTNATTAGFVLYGMAYGNGKFLALHSSTNDNGILKNLNIGASQLTQVYPVALT